MGAYLTPSTAVVICEYRMTTFKGGNTDEDIQFLYIKSPERVTCQLCSEDLTRRTIEQRQAHYDTHFPSQPQAASTSKLRPGTTLSDSVKSSSKPFSSKGKERENRENMFWHSSQTTEPPPNFSPGLIHVLKRMLTKSHDKGSTQRAWLCFDHAVHVCGEQWDRSWGCGYRNYLMACSVLMDQTRQPMYFPLLDAPHPPGVRNLQSTIEQAWRNGYDEQGAKDLKHNLVNTSKWIGTAELCVAFTYRGIPARLVDFDMKRGVEVLLQWIVGYFSEGTLNTKRTTVDEALRGAQPVIMTDKMPLILQYDGHSQTIVGCEQSRNGMINLLTFDPSRRIRPPIRHAGLAHHSPTYSPASTNKTSPSKVLRQVLHPVQTIKSGKRKANDPSGSSVSPAKRVRAATGAPGPNDDVIVIDDDDDEGQTTTKQATDNAKLALEALDFRDVLGLFRLDAKKLGRKDKYQILYFPLDDPFTDTERLERRIVTSDKVR